MTESQELFLNVEFDSISDFTGRSVENGLPVTAPLHNLEELRAWKPDDSKDAGQVFSVGTVPFLGKEIPTESTKTLVCHDMAGGYVDDRFVQGTVCKDDKWYYWDLVDTFVYFSHHFITIPPVGWINSAHENGVAVLGTFITESEEGFKRCEAIFSHEAIWKAVADKLVEIAKYYRFEGWLLNIENQINKENVENLINFVKYLKDRMHDAVEGSQVIWYDSVTVDGILDWQNELDSENCVYFNSCDGIFLNYNWSEKSLDDSAKMASKLDNRVQDVYVGVDVFGRGCYGGGGMNSVAALEVIGKYQLSAAVFAPGWVKEKLGSKNFEENQRRFWTYLSPFCNSHSVLHDNDKTFLWTDFCTGMSLNKGKSERILHINRQSMMPSLSQLQFLPLDLTSLDRHSVNIEKNASAIVFKTHFTTKSQFFVVLFKTVDRCDNLQANVIACGEEWFVPGELLYLVQEEDTGPEYYWLFRVQNDPVTVCELRCQTNKEPVQLQKVVFAATGFNATELRQIADRKRKKTSRVHNIVIKIVVESVSWSRSNNKDDVYLLSCTLNLSNIDEKSPCHLYFRTLDEEFVELGVSRCKKYRINNLAIPSPVYHGPNVRLVIKVEQTSPVHFLEVPSRHGEIVIKYAENIRK